MPDNPIEEINIVREQLKKEQQAKKNWEKKWKPYLEIREIIKEEAERIGLSEEDFYKRVTFRKPGPKYDKIGWDIKPGNEVPQTSSAMIGWRSTLDYSLERVGPLFVSPLHTMPKEIKQNYIILG